MSNPTFTDTAQQAERIIRQKLATAESTSNRPVKKTISGVQVMDADEESNGLGKAKEKAREMRAAMQQLRDRLLEAQVPCIATFPKETFINFSDTLGLYRFDTRSEYVSYEESRENKFIFTRGALIFTILIVLAIGILVPAIFHYGMIQRPAKAGALPEAALFDRVLTFLLVLALSAVAAAITAAITGFIAWNKFMMTAPTEAILKKLWSNKYAYESANCSDMDKIKIAFPGVDGEFRASLIKINKTEGLLYGIAAPPHAISFPHRTDKEAKRPDANYKPDPILYVYNERAAAIVNQPGEFNHQQVLIDMANGVDYLAHLDLEHPNQHNTEPHTACGTPAAPPTATPQKTPEALPEKSPEEPGEDPSPSDAAEILTRELT